MEITSRGIFKGGLVGGQMKNVFTKRAKKCDRIYWPECDECRSCVVYFFRGNFRVFLFWLFLQEFYRVFFFSLSAGIFSFKSDVNSDKVDDLGENVSNGWFKTLNDRWEGKGSVDWWMAIIESGCLLMMRVKLRNVAAYRQHSFASAFLIITQK